MTDLNTKDAGTQDDVWAARRKNNARLGVVFGAVALVIFLIAILKYRPL